MSPLHAFAETTKNTCVCVGASLVVLVLTTGFTEPGHIMRPVGKAAAAALAAYCVYSLAASTVALWEATDGVPDTNITKCGLLSLCLCAVLVALVVSMCF